MNTQVMNTRTCSYVKSNFTADLSSTPYSISPLRFA